MLFYLILLLKDMLMTMYCDVSLYLNGRAFVHPFPPCVPGHPKVQALEPEDRGH